MSRAYRIMLIDDDPDDITLFRKHMPSHYELFSSGDPSEARALLLSSSVDVCFIDYRLGPHDGLKIVEEWRRSGIDIPMVVITGLDIETLGENALLAGATDFVTKEGLTTAAIERATRWAVVRRHVENRRSAEWPQWEIGELLQPHREIPTHEKSKNSTQSDEEIRRVIYISRASQRLSRQGFFNLTSQAAANNHQLGITGVLVHVGGCLAQALEGPKSILEELVLAISQDERHCDMTILLDECIDTRQFVFWNMGSFMVNGAPREGGKQWQATMQQAKKVLGATPNRRAGFAELALFLGRSQSA